jgi:O-antigen ligase/tetratricopeptide (TPR) repeat protein
MSSTVRTRRARRHQAVYFDLTDTGDERFDRAIEWMLIALLAFSPLALGAVQRWSELVVFVLCAAMALALAAKLLARRDLPFVWSWTYLPVAVVVALTAVQVVPLPAWLVGVVSPHTLALRSSLAAPLGPAAGSLSHMPLSLYPEATLSNLRVLLAVAGVYVVTLNVIRRADQIRRLLLAAGIIGAIVAVISLAHLAADARQIYGMFGKTRSGWPVGPFINPNHLAQFLNLCLGAALAVLLVRFDQVLREVRRSPYPAEQVLLNIPPMVWALGGMVILCAVALVLTLSRGGIFSMLVAAAVAAFVSRRRGTRYLAWALVPIAWIVLMVVAYFAFDPLVQRIDALAQAESAPAQGRLQIVSDVLIAWKQFPWFGTGLGTFQVVYPMFDRSATLLLATHAENDYAQMLLEGGVVGLAALLVFVAMILRKYVRCIRSAPSPMASAAVGLGFALMAVMLQSLSDFGQHVPANAVLSAVVCALIVTSARASQQTSPAPQPLPSPRARPARLAGAVIASLLAAAVLLQGWRRAHAEWCWAPTRDIEQDLLRGRWVADVEVYRQLLSAAHQGAALSPRDIHYRHWLNLYRWKYISQSRDESGQLVLSDEQLDWSARVVRELLIGVRQCPTFGPSYSLAGQIEMNVLGEPRGAELIRVGWKLSQADPAANYEAGLLDAREGNWDAALAKLRHAAKIDTTGAYLDEAVQALARDLGRPDMAIKLAGQNVQSVRRIVEVLDSTSQPDAAAMARTHLAELIRSLAAAADAPQSALADAGRLAMEQNDFPAAIDYFRRALGLDYANADLRLELARALAASGQTDRALEEATTAERLGSAKARALVLELQRRPATQPAGTRGL